MFAAFFAGAILCLGLSCTYHTVHCHSEFVGKLFSKLDYVGISFLILGSLVPWLYYTFYCQYQPKVIYLTVASVLGLCAIVVSMMDHFGQPQYRSLRAGNYRFLNLHNQWMTITGSGLWIPYDISFWSDFAIVLVEVILVHLDFGIIWW